MNDSTQRDTLAVGSNELPKSPPTPLERHTAATEARDRLRDATLEAFPRSTQYRPAQDGTSGVGTGSK